jgi:hypothetical protein
MFSHKDKIPTTNLSLIKSLIGKSIVRVKRQIFKGDRDLINYEQMADGTTELLFSNDKTISIFALTEIWSVGISNLKIISSNDFYFIKDVTNNLFWQQRIKQKITRFIILKSVYASETNYDEFGFQIEFENNTQLIFEYLSEENCVDTIRIMEEYDATPYQKIVIQ